MGRFRNASKWSPQLICSTCFENLQLFAHSFVREKRKGLHLWQCKNIPQIHPYFYMYFFIYIFDSNKMSRNFNKRCISFRESIKYSWPADIKYNKILTNRIGRSNYRAEMNWIELNWSEVNDEFIRLAMDSDEYILYHNLSISKIVG